MLGQGRRRRLGTDFSPTIYNLMKDRQIEWTKVRGRRLIKVPSLLKLLGVAVNYAGHKSTGPATLMVTEGRGDEQLGGKLGVVSHPSSIDPELQEAAAHARRRG